MQVKVDVAKDIDGFASARPEDLDKLVSAKLSEAKAGQQSQAAQLTSAEKTHKAARNDHRMFQQQLLQCKAKDAELLEVWRKDIIEIED